MNQPDSILALDVGDKRIGLALAVTAGPFPYPLSTITNDTAVWNILRQIIQEQHVIKLVVGLPRDMNGNDTEQTRIVSDFANRLEKESGLPVFLQDEAATSLKAEEELRARGKPYDKSDIDALAATYILEDYLQGVKHDL